MFLVENRSSNRGKFLGRFNISRRKPRKEYGEDNRVVLRERDCVGPSPLPMFVVSCLEEVGVGTDESVLNIEFDFSFLCLVLALIFQ
jgi:hypothetical protein